MKRTWIALAVALAGAALSVRADAASGLVLQDQTAAARRAKGRPLLTPLWRGEALELRGARRLAAGLGPASPARRLCAPGGGDAAARGRSQRARARRATAPGAPAAWGRGAGLGLAAALVERASPAWLAGVGGAELLEGLVTLQDRLAARANSPGASSNQQVRRERACGRGRPLWPSTAQPGARGRQPVALPRREPARLLRATRRPAARSGCKPRCNRRGPTASRPTPRHRAARAARPPRPVARRHRPASADAAATQPPAAAPRGRTGEPRLC